MTDAPLSLTTIAASRPSPWALPLTFADAVLDPAHDAHDEAVAQWRGLLAIVALQNLHGSEYGLSVREATPEGGSPLAHMLSLHRPAAALPHGDALWDRPHLVMLHRADQADGVMAMINPLCLISPGASSGWVWPEFAWLASGLTDPLAGAGALPFTEIALLASWLSVVEGALRQSGTGAAALCEQVHKYRADCLALFGPIAIDVACERTAGCPLPMPFAALFTEARIAAIADPAAMAMGRIALPVSGAAWPKGLIVADPALCAHYGQDARQIIIWGARSLSELMADPALLATTKAEVADAGWLLVTADDLFTWRMVSLGQQGCVPSHAADFTGAVMPLRPLALLLGEQLTELASCEYNGDAATVTLALPMDNGRYLSISREYRTDASAEDPLWLPGGDWAIHAASIWPDFRSDAFHHYTARLTHNDRYSGRGALRAVSVLSRDLILAELAARDSRMDAVAAMDSLNEGRVLYAARGRIETQSGALAGEEETVWRSTLPFDAIGWVDQNATRGDAFCGLILLNLPDAPVNILPVQAAVDFGTTNTVACFDDGAAIRFADRLLVPIQSESSGFTRARLHDRRYHYARFYPLGRRALPTPSVTIGRGAETQSPNFSGGGGVFRNVIFFPLLDAEIENGEAQELALLAREMQSCHFNLKWSDALADVDASSDFLEQTLWMIAAEAAALGHNPAAIQWRFSVPDAMAIKRRRHFERMLEDLTARVGGAMVPVVSEGLAAATHMLAGGDAATQQFLTLVIDIGGGTSDIAIWDGSDVAWKGSFRLAGQDFFTRTLNRNPAILDGMGLGFWGRMLGQDVAGVRADTLVHVAELLFSGNRLVDAMADHWDDHLACDGGAVLRMAGLTYLGGMAWYLGRVTRQLLRQHGLHYGAQSRPAFALCGRGAGLFRFIHNVLDPLGDSIVTDALTLFSIAAELDDEPRPQLLLTRDAKMEVVRGMMTPAPRFARAAKIWNGEQGAAIPSFQPAGLSLHYPGGAAVQADAAFDTAALSGRALHLGFDEMDAFLKALSHLTGLYIDVRHGVAQSAWDRMEHDVLAAMEDARHDDGRAPQEIRPLEPPFIIALRRLLSELTDPAARTQGRIVAEFIG